MPIAWHVEINVWALLAGVGGFLLAWAAKHFLDRLILPRVLDRISRINKRLTLRRANKLRERFNSDLKYIGNFPALMVRMIAEIYYMFLIVGFVSTIGIVGLPAFLVMAILMAFRTAGAERHLKMLTSPVYRSEIETRIKTLLISAETPADEIDVFLEGLNKAPAITLQAQLPGVT
jgi:hypothetical protein